MSTPSPEVIARKRANQKAKRRIMAAELRAERAAAHTPRPLQGVRDITPKLLSNPTQAAGEPGIARVAEMMQLLIPTQSAPDGWAYPVLPDMPGAIDGRWSNRQVWDLLANPNRFEPTPDGFAIQLDTGEPLYWEIGNICWQMVTWRSQDGALFTNRVLMVAPGGRVMDRALWGLHRWPLLDWLIDQHRQTMERADPEFQWELECVGPWWLEYQKPATRASLRNLFLPGYPSRPHPEYDIDQMRIYLWKSVLSLAGVSISRSKHLAHVRAIRKWSEQALTQKPTPEESLISLLPGPTISQICELLWAWTGLMPGQLSSTT